LNPTWISEGNYEVEFLTVQVNLKEFSIRCVNGYGPQENDPLERKQKCWSSLDTDKLSKCFDNNFSIKSQVIQWEKYYKECIAQSFKKIRITEHKKETEIQMLMEKRIKLRNISKLLQDEDELEEINEEIHNIEIKLSNLVSEENTKKVKDNLSQKLMAHLTLLGFGKLRRSFSLNMEKHYPYCHNPGQPKTKSPGVVLLSVK
jgi:hypothetical protein